MVVMGNSLMCNKWCGINVGTNNFNEDDDEEEEDDFGFVVFVVVVVAGTGGR